MHDEIATKRFARWTYVCDINIDIHVKNFYFTQPNSFTTEPVSMVYLMNITI